MGNDLLAPVLSLWPLILPAAALLVFVRPAARLVFFALGLLFFLAVSFIPRTPSLHGEGMGFAFLGLALCAAVILAEIAARTVGILRRPRGKRY